MHARLTQADEAKRAMKQGVREIPSLVLHLMIRGSLSVTGKSFTLTSSPLADSLFGMSRLYINVPQLQCDWS